MSTERIVVDERIADAFVKRFAERAVELPLGDPRKGPVILGSVIDASTVERCNALIDDAMAKGAVLVCGGKATALPTRFHSGLPRPTEKRSTLKPSRRATQ